MALKVQEDMRALGEEYGNHSAIYFDGKLPTKEAGVRAPTGEERIILKDFDTRRRAYREVGEDFRDLRNQGEFSGTYFLGATPGSDGLRPECKDFHFTKGNTVPVRETQDQQPIARVHSHPNFTLPFPSRADYHTAAGNFANHGENNYLVDSSNKAYHFGPSANGPQFTRLDIRLGAGTPPPEPRRADTPAFRPIGSDLPPTQESDFWRS